jgi:small basic protein (TIGR04137 family)
MSLDSSLKVSGKLAGKRSVMTRTERIAKLITDKKFDPAKNNALNLPKTGVPKS